MGTVTRLRRTRKEPQAAPDPAPIDLYGSMRKAQGTVIEPIEAAMLAVQRARAEVEAADVFPRGLSRFDAIAKELRRAWHAADTVADVALADARDTAAEGVPQ